MSVTSAEVGGQGGNTKGRTLRPEAAAPPGPDCDKVRPPVLVTEQQVRFSTAASVSAPLPRTRRWLDPVHRAVGAVWQRLAATATATPPKQVHYAPRSRSYYDSSINSRERYRL